MRTIIDLPTESLQRLDRWACSQKISRAEAVRRAVSDLLERVATPSSPTHQPAAFGLWKQALPAGMPIPPERDGLFLQQTLREEWPE